MPPIDEPLHKLEAVRRKEWSREDVIKVLPYEKIYLSGAPSSSPPQRVPNQVCDDSVHHYDQQRYGKSHALQEKEDRLRRLNEVA